MISEDNELLDFTRLYGYDNAGNRLFVKEYNLTSEGVEPGGSCTTTNFSYDTGTQLIGEETNGNLTVYLYDASGSTIGFQYHASTYAADVWNIYWYEKNLFGDIVAV